MPSFGFKLATALASTLVISTYIFTRQPATAKIKQRTQEVVQKVESRSWASLRLDFLLPLQLSLTETLLEKGWNIVHKSFGPIDSVGDPIITKGWALTSVKIPLRLQQADFGLLLQMTHGGSLVGLQFTGLGNGWKEPSYAGQVVESEMTLGKEFQVGATLCLPRIGEESKIPCVVFLSGSGPCDRDSTIAENKPLKDLALGLAARGIASIRFDKVTYTFRSRKNINITLTDEYVHHAVDAIRQGRNHPNIDPDQVFILGHSLGAVVAPALARDTSVAGCIIMAGPAEPIYKIFIRQLEYIESLDGPESQHLSSQIDDARVRAELADSDDLTMSTPAKKLPFGMGPAYWLDYRRFDHIETLNRLEKPVLVLQGARDYQVTVQDDYQHWRNTLCERDGVRFHLYDQLNHLFIAGTGLSTPLEYSLQGNVDEQVMGDIADWVFESC